MTGSYYSTIPFFARGGMRLMAIACCLTAYARADQFGNFTYIDMGSTITITGYPTSASGPVVIPDTIASKPVTTVGAGAFYNCTGLTSVTIPTGVTYIANGAFVRCLAMTQVLIPSTVTAIGTSAFAVCTSLTSVVIPSGVATIEISTFNTCSALTSITIPSSVTSIGGKAFQYCGNLTNITIPGSVTTVGEKAFSNCRKLTSLAIPASMTTMGTEVFGNCNALTSISVDEANPSYSSLDGVLFDKGKTTLLAFPPGLSGGYAIPASVTTIGTSAFLTCKRLVGVTFPPGITDIQPLAFSTCSTLLYANFTGSAPNVASNAFQLTADGITVYYLNSAEADFTQSPWSDYNNIPINMGDNGTPVSDWLLSKGLPANSNLQSDSNGDGVNLLMAYALNLDPHQNLSHSTPQAVMGANQISMSYYGGAPGITYTVLASDNLQTWNTSGVSVSAPDANQVCTATLAISGPRRFICLRVNN